MPSTATASVLDPYVPRLASEWDLEAPGASWRQIDATCCFVDISGFTALSERLARRGRIGAEELTEVLNHVFSRMLGIAYDKGGSLLKFGGDALLISFTGDDHAVLAARAAVGMRGALREARTLSTSVGRVQLRMSVGLHSGLFHFFRAGALHHELLITGPAATTTARMEQTAEAGEIVVSHQCAERLPASAVGVAKGDGWLVRWRKDTGGGPGPAPARPSVATTSAAAGSWVPIALRQRLAGAGGEAEHRLASVAFLEFQGVDGLLDRSGPGALSEALDGLVGSVQAAAEAESVTFLASDIDADGGKLILATGVPVTLEDDEGRLLRAVRRVVEGAPPLPVRVGVNRGHVFAGEIGTAFRRTFTVMGDTVNVAARLMAAAAPGEVLATTPVLDRARTLFGVEAIEPFMVKGKAAPVQAYLVGAATGSRPDQSVGLPFRGRDKELEALLLAYRSATEGSGGSVLIEAERGAGKTRLMSELLEAARPARVLWLQGEAHGTAVPYLPLRQAMRSVLGVEAEDRLRAGHQLSATLEAADPRLAPFAPLLAPMVDAEVPSTPQSEAVAQEFVSRRIADLVVSALDALCETPLVVVAEDAHWFDDTTAEICTRVAAAAGNRRWLVCATRRAEPGGFVPGEPDTQVLLAPLADDTARQLVEGATDGVPLRPQQRDGIVARAGGNPLFLSELMRMVRAADVESLPESLDAVAMREIDSLPPQPRRVLRVASVLGGSFDSALVNRLLDGEALEELTDPLQGLEAQVVTQGDGRFRFRHAVLQEAAYQSLPFRTRLALHRRAGEAIESGGAERALVAPLLSFHFLAAQEWERTWHYARLAAETAKAAHAPSETAEHLERAVVAARRLGTVRTDELAELLTELGDTLQVVGEYERSDSAFRRAGQMSKGHPLLRARVACQRAYLSSEYLGHPSPAVRQLRFGRAQLDALGPEPGTEAEHLHSLLLAREAQVRHRQGRPSVALDCGRRAAEEADRVGDRRALAISLAVIDASLAQMGRPDEATHMERVLELYQELDDHVRIGTTLNNLALVAFNTRRWDRAADYFGRSIEASSAAGDLGNVSMAQVNLGELRVNQGRLTEAAEVLDAARRTAESFADRFMIAAAAIHLGRAKAFLGDLDGGLAILRHAAVTFDDIDSQIDSLETRARIGEILVFADRLAEAQGALDEARAIERTIGETPYSALLDRVELTMAARSGAESTVAARLEAVLERARRLWAFYDELVVLSLAESLGLAEHHRELAQLEEELGVVSLPAIRGATRCR